MKARQVRVLMLGWEYPPRFAGGLGKACQGLSNAMAKQGAQVFFVLPTFPQRVTSERLEVVGAQQCMAEAGWIMDANSGVGSPPPEFTSGVTSIQSSARLFPYGAHPSTPISDRIRKMMTDGTRAAPRKPLVNRDAKEARSPASPAESPNQGEIYGKNLWSEIENFAFTVRHLAETHEVDLVHAHDWMTFPAAFEFHRMTGAPVFLHVHATEYDRSGESLNNDVFRIEREGFRRAHHIFAVSRYTAGIIERLYGVHRKKISVVYNAPDGHASVPVQEARKPQVIFLGRLTFQKGPDHFLKAAAIVARHDPQAKFVLCGTGDMLDKLRQMAYRLGVEPRTHFAGFVEPTQVDQILYQSRVLVMPSVSEPFGLVALEAIRCGIPVILSKQSGVREVLPRALQVDFWDHEKLADQMLAALRLRSLSRQLVEEGMDHLHQLSWERSAHQVLESYHRQLGTTYAQAVGGAHGH